MVGQDYDNGSRRLRVAEPRLPAQTLLIRFIENNSGMMHISCAIRMIATSLSFSLYLSLPLFLLYLLLPHRKHQRAQLPAVVAAAAQ